MSRRCVLSPPMRSLLKWTGYINCHCPGHLSLKQGTDCCVTHPGTGKWRSKHNFLTSCVCIITQISGIRCPIATSGVPWTCWWEIVQFTGLLWGDSLGREQPVEEGEPSSSQPWRTAQSWGMRKVWQGGESPMFCCLLILSASCWQDYVLHIPLIWLQ